LLDGGTEAESAVPSESVSGPSDAAIDAAALHDLDFPPLPTPNPPTPGVSPTLHPRKRTPRKLVSPSQSPSTSPIPEPRKHDGSGFEAVKIKGARRQKKDAQMCPEGFFCTERESCKLNHSKDENLFFKNPLAKTKACTRNLGGVCDKHPDSCNYAHSSKDARCLRCRQRGHFVGNCVQTKTRPCRRKNGGVCDRDPLMCPFAHSKKDARCLHCKERGHFIDQCPQKIGG